MQYYPFRHSTFAKKKNMQKIIPFLVSILLVCVAFNGNASNPVHFFVVKRDKESSRDINMTEQRCQESKKSRSSYKTINAHLYPQSNKIELNSNSNIGIAQIIIMDMFGNYVCQDVCNTAMMRSFSINLPVNEGDYIITILNEYVHYEGHFYL